jgi:hypothetical protein
MRSVESLEPVLTSGVQSAPTPPTGPSAEQEGFLIDPDYAVAIDSGESRGNRWWVEEHQTKDGIQFDVGIIEPKRRRTDSRLLIGTAWGTQVLGLNLHHGLGAAQLGAPVTIVGPEKNASVTLAESGRLALAYINYQDHGKNGFADPTHLMYKGFSRGAMLGFGLQSLAKEFGRQIIFSHLDDPCLAKKLSNLDLSDVAEVMSKGPKELAGTARNISSLILHPARRKHYVHTVDLSPRGLRQFVRTGRALFTGEAGDLAAAVPKDAQLHVRFFRQSLANQRREFKRRLAGKPGVSFSDVNGSHTEGTSPETLDQTAQQLSGVIIQLSLGIHPAELDYSLIHEAALAA